jgi:hypothetical protein
MADKIDQRVDVLHASDSTAQESSEGRDFLLGSAAPVERMRSLSIRWFDYLRM